MQIQHFHVHVKAHVKYLHGQNQESSHSQTLSYLEPVIKSHHYPAMAIMRSAHLFSTAVPHHKLSSFTLGPDALEVMTM